MSDTELILTPQDLLTILQDMVRRKEPTEKIVQVHGVLAPLVGDIPKEITTKIFQVVQGLWKQERNLATEIKEWVVATSGAFDATTCDKNLGIATKSDKRNRDKVLERLCKEGIIERYGDKRGCFRLRETDLQPMDIMSPSEQPLELAYPFYLDVIFVTLPRNIIIIAGEPDSGKTAFLMLFAWLNRDKFEVHYFNSEMGEMELRSRLSKFGKPLAEWQKVHFWERSSNFADVIRPDAINVIDFMEITEDFWKIGTWIKQIHDRLRKGITVIAIQKARGASIGRGGHVTVEKPRLYLTMEPGKVTIVKCKNWRREDFNPNGQELRFRLVRGCEFIIDELWKKPEPPMPKKARSYGEFVRERGL